MESVRKKMQDMVSKARRNRLRKPKEEAESAEVVISKMKPTETPKFNAPSDELDDELLEALRKSKRGY